MADPVLYIKPHQNSCQYPLINYLDHGKDSDEISEIFIKLGSTDKITLGKFLSEYYFTSIQGNRNALLFGEANVPNESTIRFK